MCSNIPSPSTAVPANRHNNNKVDLCFNISDDNTKLMRKICRVYIYLPNSIQGIKYSFFLKKSFNKKKTLL